MSFGGHKHAFLLGVYSRIELLAQRIYKYFALIGIAKSFSLPLVEYVSFSCYIALPTLGFVSLLLLICQISFYKEMQIFAVN